MYTAREIVKRLLPRQARFLYRSLRDKRDFPTVLACVLEERVGLSMKERMAIVDECYSQIADKNAVRAALRFLCSGNGPIPPMERLALVQEVTRTRNYGRDAGAILAFLQDETFPIDALRRAQMLRQFAAITRNVQCHHTEEEMFQYVRAILAAPKAVRGAFVEAGCFKGGSTAKFSLAAKIAERQLLVFDSFEGIPAHSEGHDMNIFGRPAFFREGSYRGELEEVMANVRRYGSVGSCEFKRGWFDDTLPAIKGPIAGIYLDVDLAASTRTCLQYLYPLLEHGGVLFSQDGHLPLVIDVFSDDLFWEREVGCRKPYIEGLGTRKLIKIVKSVVSG